MEASGSCVARVHPTVLNPGAALRIAVDRQDDPWLEVPTFEYLLAFFRADQIGGKYPSVAAKTAPRSALA